MAEASSLRCACVGSLASFDQRFHGLGTVRSCVAAPVVRGFASLESDACGVGHLNNGALVLRLLYNDVNFALAQSTFKQLQHVDFLHEGLLGHGVFSGITGGGGLWTNQQINVAAFLGVVHARAEQPHCRALAKCDSGGLAYGLNLVGVESHRVAGRVFVFIGVRSRLLQRSVKRTDG